MSAPAAIATTFWRLAGLTYLEVREPAERLWKMRVECLCSECAVEAVRIVNFSRCLERFMDLHNLL